MRQILFTLFAVALVLALFSRGRAGTGPVLSVEAIGGAAKPASLSEQLAATAVKEEEAEQKDAEPAIVPVFFPKAKVVSRVSDPEDAEGRKRVIETVETSMKEPFVRVERVIARGDGGRSEVEDEVAMVANQLLLQKPDLQERAAFLDSLKAAGAVDVKEISEDSFLATFPARPEDPRALDGFMSRVREVAGNDITVEPNYIRKIF